MNSLPPSLVRFESELGGAIGRRNRRRPARLVARTALATAAVAAIALGTLSAVSGHDPSAVARAAAALAASDGAIMHVVLVTTETNADGTTSSERSESWERIGPDNAVRESIQSAAGRSFETSAAGGETQLYDPAAHTVYVQRSDADKVDLSALKQAQAAQRPASDALKAAKLAKAAREGTPLRGTATTDRFRTKIGALLGSGKAREDGHVTVDGRDAIRITAAAGDMTLLVDAGTYEPIEWRVTRAGGTELTRFSTFERLAASDAGPAVFDLAAQHPDATVDRDANHFGEAFTRLTGNKPAGSEDLGDKPTGTKPGS